MSYLNEIAENNLPLLQDKVEEMGFKSKLKWIKGDNSFYNSLDLVIDDENVYQYRIQSIMRGFGEDVVELDVEAFLAAVAGNGGNIPDTLIKTLEIQKRIEIKQCVNLSLTEGHYKLDTSIWYPVASSCDDNEIYVKGEFEKSWISVNNSMNYIVRPTKTTTFNVVTEVIKGYDIYWFDDDFMEDGYYFQENSEAKTNEQNYCEKTVKVIQYT